VNDEKTSLTAALRHLAEQERRNPSEHATPGELTAYHEGTLPEPIAARVREHLAHCKLCSDLLLDLAGFADLAPPPGVPELTDAEVEEDWQALRKRLDKEGGRPPIDEKPPGEVIPIRRPSTSLPMKPDREFSPWKVAAAAILVAAVGLSVWKMTSKPTTPQQRQPDQIIDQGLTLRGTETQSEHVSANRSTVFNFYPLENHARYEGQILQGRNVVWKTSDVEQTSSPSSNEKKVSFRIPGGSLEPGVYRAVLYGLGQGPRQTAGSIDFEVNEP
jgi:hypothetical protein